MPKNNVKINIKTSTCKILKEEYETYLSSILRISSKGF